MTDQNVDLATLLLENPGGFLDTVTAGIAQRVGQAAVQQDALAQFAKVQPELAMPENQHLLRAEIQRVASESPELRGDPYRILEKVHEKFLAQAEAQKRAEAEAERQQQAQTLADKRREDADAERESTLNHAQTMSELQQAHARTTGQGYDGYVGVGHAFDVYDPNTGRSRSPRDGEDQSADDELDRYVAEQNQQFVEYEARKQQQSRDAMKLDAARKNRAARGLPPMTDAQEIDFIRKQG